MKLKTVNRCLNVIYFVLFQTFILILLYKTKIRFNRSEVLRVGNQFFKQGVSCYFAVRFLQLFYCLENYFLNW